MPNIPNDKARIILKEKDTEADPFYQLANIEFLEQKAAEYKAGRLNLEEHELMEKGHYD